MRAQAAGQRPGLDVSRSRPEGGGGRGEAGEAAALAETLASGAGMRAVGGRQGRRGCLHGAAQETLALRWIGQTARPGSAAPSDSRGQEQRRASAAATRSTPPGLRAGGLLRTAAGARRPPTTPAALRPHRRQARVDDHVGPTGAQPRSPSGAAARPPASRIAPAESKTRCSSVIDAVTAGPGDQPVGPPQPGAAFRWPGSSSFRCAIRERPQGAAPSLHLSFCPQAAD